MCRHRAPGSAATGLGQGESGLTHRPRNPQLGMQFRLLRSAACAQATNGLRALDTKWRRLDSILGSRTEWQ